MLGGQLEINYGRLLYYASQELLPLLIPFVVAGLVAWWPGERPRRKFLFVLASVVLAFGSVGVGYVLYSPIEFMGVHLAPVWEDYGYDWVGLAFFHVHRAATFIALPLLVIAIVGAPVWLRLRMWRRLVSEECNAERSDSA